MFSAASAWQRAFTILLLSIVAGGVPALSRAAMVVVGFEGVVGLIEDSYCGCVPDGVAVGDTLRGYYVYTTDAIDTNADPQIGLYTYLNGSSQIVVYLEGYVLRSNPGAVDIDLEIWNDVVAWGAPRDVYDFRSDSNTTTFGLTPTDRIRLRMSDGHAYVLSSDAIPQEPPVLSEWPYFHWFALEGDSWRILGDITALQTGPPSSIPPDGPMRMRVSVAPNPFGGATTIEWKGDPGEEVRVSIHDVTGRLIRGPVSPGADAGVGAFVWDGTDGQGRHVPSGVYFVRAVSAGAAEMRKIVLLR